MLIIMERFGNSYTFEVHEGFEGDDKDVEVDDAEPVKRKPSPEICILEAVDAVNNLLRCIFPEMEGYHLELMPDNPDEDPATGPKAGDGGIDLGKV